MPDRMQTWAEFWAKTADTIGIGAAFSFIGAAYLLWVSPNEHSVSRGFTVILAAQILNGVTTAFVHGYLGWSIFIAPVVGLVCGLVAVPVLMAVIKTSNERAADVIAAALKRLPGGETKEP